MKKSILFLVTVLISNLIIGQSIVDTTKMWRTKITKQCPSNPNFQIKTETIKFSDDTIIDSLNYKKVYRATDEFYTNWSLCLYIREDTNQRIYFRSDTSQQEYLLYDFNAHINDTLIVSSVFVNVYGDYVFATNQMIVDSIDTIFFAGQNRKRISLDGENHWIEGIGNIEHGVLNNNIGFATSVDLTLLCVYQSDTIIYSSGGNCYEFYECPTNITEQQIDKINIYPNPANENLIISVNNLQLTINNVSIIDITGKKVKSIKTKGQSKKYIVNVKDLPAGFYFAKVQTNKGSIVKKLIVN